MGSWAFVFPLRSIHWVHIVSWPIIDQEIRSLKKTWPLGGPCVKPNESVSFFPKPESADAHQRSHDLGIQIGYQRRNKEVLAWVKKRRRNIRREDLISFLCGKAPPPRTTRAPPRVTMVPTSRPSTPETGSSVETDLQPFREAIALHGGLLSPGSLCVPVVGLNPQVTPYICYGFTWGPKRYWILGGPIMILRSKKKKYRCQYMGRKYEPYYCGLLWVE